MRVIYGILKNKKTDDVLNSKLRMSGGLTTEYSYTTGFQAGVVTGFLASIIFTVFMAVHVTEVDPDFISKIAENFSKSYDIGVGVFSFTVLLSGFATTIVLTLSFMQLLKRRMKEQSNTNSTLN